LIYEKYWQNFVDERFELIEAQQKAIAKIAENADITFAEVFR
jgi:hypothetical protein